MVSVDADGAKEHREAAHVNAPEVRRVCACVDWARLAFRAIEEVMGEDSRVDHGKGSNDGRIRRSAGLTSDDEFGVALAFHVCSDAGELDLGSVRHCSANECRHGAGECAGIDKACSVPLLEIVDFPLL